MQHHDTTTDVFPSHYTREQVLALLAHAGRYARVIATGAICVHAKANSLRGSNAQHYFKPTDDGLFRASSVLRFITA